MKRNKKFRIFAAGLCTILALSGASAANLYAAETDQGIVSSGTDTMAGQSSGEPAEEAEKDLEDSFAEPDPELPFEEDSGTPSEDDSGSSSEENLNLSTEEDPDLPSEWKTEFPSDEEVQVELEENRDDRENPEGELSGDETVSAQALDDTDIWASDDEILLEEEAALSVAASTDGLPSVSYVAATQNMDTDYALAYAFRSGLTSIDPDRTNGFSWPGGAFHTQISSNYAQDGITGWCENWILLKMNKWNENYRNQNYVTYTNVADYNGQKLDLKITVVSWAGYNENIKDSAGNTVEPWLSFNTKKIDIAYLGIARVRLRFELLYSGTSTRANVGAHTTMRDIDAGQSLWFSSASNVDSIYLLSGNGYVTNQVAASPAPDHLELTGGVRGDQRTPDDVNTWVQLNFTGYFETYFCEHDEWDQLVKTSQAIHFDATPKTIGIYPVPEPEKKVGDQSQAYTDMAANSTQETAYSAAAGEKIRYEIAQTIYPGTYSSFIVKDTLDSCLTYESASVSTSGGGDASSWFQIEHDAGTNTVTFTAKNMNQEYMFNNVTFYFIINASLKDIKTITDHGHNDGTEKWYIGNMAQRTIGTDIKNTGTVYICGLTSGSYYVNKVDAEDGSQILEPAVFELQEWNQDSGKYVRLRDLTRDDTTLLYGTGSLSRSETNEGRFRIVETSAPKGYNGGWSREIRLASDTSGTTFTAENESDLLPVGDITVTKKIRESDIIRAHGNPVFRFTVYGTDQKGRKYTFEDYVEFSENQYKTEGEYAVLSCVFRNIPVGEYTVSEKKTLRYRLESVRADTSNVQISGGNGLVTLSKENLSGALTFQNVKTRFDRLSHTDVLTNSIPVGQ